MRNLRGLQGWTYLETPGGPWRPLNLPEGPWKPLEVPGSTPKNALEGLEGMAWTRPGSSWNPLETPPKSPARFWKPFRVGQKVPGHNQRSPKLRRAWKPEKLGGPGGSWNLLEEACPRRFQDMVTWARNSPGSWTTLVQANFGGFEGSSGFQRFLEAFAMVLGGPEPMWPCLGTGLGSVPPQSRGGRGLGRPPPGGLQGSQELPQRAPGVSRSVQANLGAI